jgi:sialic acid synthase SpsE
MNINGRLIGKNEVPFIVIEAGAGHNGRIEDMMDIFTAAQEAGADAVKIQTYTADSLTIDNQFVLGPDSPWAGEKLWDLYERGQTPAEWLPELFQEAKRRNLILFSSPFAPKDVDLLEKHGCPAYKIASAEITHKELLLAVRSTKKPVFISTGMASLREVGDAANLFGIEDKPICLMHCISGYPAELKEANLWRIKRLEREFGPDALGWSDHTIGTTASILAIGQGASAIEKHCAVNGGPDSDFGLRTYEVKNFVHDVTAAWEALQVHAAPSEGPTEQLRRSIYVVADIAKGDMLTPENIAVIRPAGGMHPRELPLVLGTCATRDIRRGEPLHLGMTTVPEKPSK